MAPARNRPKCVGVLARGEQRKGDRERVPILGLGDHQRPEEVVPADEERQDPQRGEGRPAERQDDPQKILSSPAPSTRPASIRSSRQAEEELPHQGTPRSGRPGTAGAGWGSLSLCRPRLFTSTNSGTNVTTPGLISVAIHQPEQQVPAGLKPAASPGHSRASSRTPGSRPRVTTIATTEEFRKYCGTFFLAQQGRVVLGGGRISPDSRSAETEAAHRRS